MPNDKRHLVEGYWDCQYCGCTEIRGRFKSCPNCGHGRDASVRFYTKEIDEEHAISREEFQRETAEADKNSHSSSAHYTEAQSVSSGPSLFDRKEGQGKGDESDAHDETDWYCDYCDSYNPATVDVCRNCGAQREMTSGVTYAQTMGQVARTYDAKGNLVKERDLSNRTKPKPQPQTPVSAPASKSPFGIVRLVILGILAVMLVSCVVSCLVPKTKKITVDSFDWERTVSIEQLKTVDESDWSLPDKARLDHKSREIREYQQVLDHYEEVPYQVSEEVLDHYETYTTTVDNGDGTFEVEEHQEPVYKTEYHTEYRREPVYVSVPIYDTKYYYQIEKWVPERDVTTSGKDHKPYWGETKLAPASGEYGTGEEREGQKTGTYGVTDSEGNHYLADEDFWNSLELGQELTVKVDGDHIEPAD